MPDKKILIIEDDPKIIELASLHLKDAGCIVEQAVNGLKGLEMALSEKYHLIILDLMLPGMDGMEVCKRIKENRRYLPVMMLTARSEEIDKVLGLEVGADDYLTKPFGIREFIARVKAILRRVELEDEKNKAAEHSKLIEYPGLRIDIEKHEVRIDGRKVELTAKEFDLLTLFASHPGNTYNRERLLGLIWGYQYEGYEHTVSSHMNRLRNKIERDPANPKLIKTLWGVGYRFEIPGE